MKTPQIPAMPGMSPLGLCRCGHGSDACTHSGCEAMKRASENDRTRCLKRDGRFDILNKIETDQKTVAERKWTAPLKPKADQKACDIGLFSDDSKQSELF